MVRDALHPQNPALFEAPKGQGLSKLLVTRPDLLPTSNRLHHRVEEFVREELQGPSKDNPGVIPGLQSSNHHCLLANSMWEFLDREVRVVAVGGGATGQYLQAKGVLLVDKEADTTVQQRCRHTSSNFIRLDQIL